MIPDCLPTHQLARLATELWKHMQPMVEVHVDMPTRTLTIKDMTGHVETVTIAGRDFRWRTTRIPVDRPGRAARVLACDAEDRILAVV